MPNPVKLIRKVPSVLNTKKEMTAKFQKYAFGKDTADRLREIDPNVP